MREIYDYVGLIEEFLNHGITVKEFETTYIDKYLNEEQLRVSALKTLDELKELQKNTPWNVDTPSSQEDEGKVGILVKLLEEGTPTMRPTQAIVLENGLYQILATPDYNSEDEVWEFEPGTIVAGQQIDIGKNRQFIIAIHRPESKEQLINMHPNLPIVKIKVLVKRKLVAVDAIKLNDYFYKLLPTDTYNCQTDLWEFSPGSVVRVAQRRNLLGRKYLLAFDQIREDRMDAGYANYFKNKLLHT